MRFSKNLVKNLFLTALLALPPTLVPAGHAGAEGLGYVDARRLIAQAPQGLDEVKKLEAEFAERSRELKGKLDGFKAQQQDLEKNGVLMTAEEVRAKTADLRELQRQLRRAQREYQEDYERRRSQGLSRLENMITEVIVAVAKRKKLDVVLQQVVYASPKVDLTDQVLAELKKRYKK